MTPQEIQSIYDLLANRIQPTSAREGAAIMALASKLVASFKREDPVELIKDKPANVVAHTQ